MRALVTGSTGCLGSSLAAALLERGIEVTGLRYQNEPVTALEGLNIRLAPGDVLDIATLRPALEGVDWVFHAAAIADDWNYPVEAVYRTNVEGTRNMLTAAMEAGVRRLVLTGSAAALGLPRPGKPLLDESCWFNLRPHRWPYAHSKHLAEMALLEFVDRGLDALTVLPTAIMGPGDQHFIVGQVIARIVNREFFPLPRGGTNVIDARDAAAAHIAAAERGAPGERYVLGGYNLPHKEMLQAVGEAVGARPRHWQIPHVMLAPVAAGVAALRALHIPCRIDANRVLLAGHTVYYNNSKAVRELGLALRPFRQTVRDTYEWYVAHGLLEPLPVSGQTLSAATD